MNIDLVGKFILEQIFFLFLWLILVKVVREQEEEHFGTIFVNKKLIFQEKNWIK